MIRGVGGGGGGGTSQGNLESKMDRLLTNLIKS